MQTRLPKFLPVGLCLSLCILEYRGAAQAPAELVLQLYGGLNITGIVGTVYQIQCVPDLAQATNGSGWHCLEFLRLPASPYLWTDKTAVANGRRFYRVLASSDPTNMVFVPPGTFRMGSASNEVDRSLKEGPQTEVTISHGFWMGQYLVTQAEFQAVTGNNPSFFSLNNGYTLDLSRPVDSVSWYDATGYCAQLTQQERAAGRIPTNCVYRLPTEAEWEYACRALTSTRFAYGDDPGYTGLTNYAWYYGNSGGMTQPVGQKLPNVWRLYDMCGNLEEWCEDWYGSYAGGSQLDPQGPVTGLLRVLRGGYWGDPASYCRSASRNEHDPTARHYHIGFRVVMAPN